MPNVRSFMPSAGNPMLPTFVMFAIFFPALMIGFPLYVHLTGGPVGQTIAIVVMVGIVGLISLAILAWSVHSIEQERRQLRTGDVWAVWTVPEDEYRRFVGEERRRMIPLVLFLAAVFTGFGVLLFIENVDVDALAIVASVFGIFILLIIALEARLLVANDRTREVRIGPQGIEAIGQYHQVQGPRHVLDAVGLETGTPPHLIFWISIRRTRERPRILRVPVPEDRMEEAQAIVERFAPRPPAGETYPELLKRRRSLRTEGTVSQ